MREAEAASGALYGPQAAAPEEPALETLRRIAEAGAGRLPPGLVEEIEAVEARAGERLAHSREHVVIAVAGGTGSGKSALVNALLGEAVTRPGVRRPTTDHAVAAVVGEVDAAAPLLDWLRVYERHAVAPEGPLADLAGAVLLDLPDMDSIVREHGQVAERLMARCDLLVWVVDPLKYAHAVVQEGYLARLAHHVRILTVVLNHSDRLAEADREPCLAHLRELLAERGLAPLAVHATAAPEADGVERLREHLAGQVRERRAPLERIRADVADRVARVAAAVPEPEALVLDREALAEGLGAAVNESALVARSGDGYRRAGAWMTGSPLRRLASRIIPALGPRAAGAAGADAGPAPTVAEAPVRNGLLTAVEPAARELPAPAAERLRTLAAEAAPPLAEDLRERLAALPLDPAPRRWWRVVAAARGLGEGAALLGGAWLIARGIAGWLALPPVPAPAAVGELPWPLVLIAAGLTGTTLAGMAVRPLLRRGAVRQRRILARAIRREAAATDRPPLEPVTAELERCRALGDLARRAATGHG